MFATLPDGSRLPRHRDPYAGSLRFHLGLATPSDDRCFIEVDGQRYSWRDGEGCCLMRPIFTMRKIPAVRIG